MVQNIITAHIREEKGKEAVKKLRENKQIPAVFYGPNAQPMMLTIKNSDIHKIIRQTAGENVILSLQIESESGSDTKKVMLRELQMDPIKDFILHVDFYEVSMDKEVTVDVPIRLNNTPAGVTMGGVLQQIRRELSITCLPDKLIQRLDVDVSGLDIGDAVHIEDIPLPEGVRFLDEGHLTVAVVVAPTVVEEVEEEEVEAEVVEEETAEEEGAVSEES